MNERTIKSNNANKLNNDVFQNTDIVNLDITTYNAGGYHGDLNETFCVGNVDADGQRVVRTAFDCLAAALELVKPGTLYRDLGTVIERVARANKCSVVRTYCGHGIGSLFHTIPNIPHYAKNKAKGTMKVGHVFTIEPVRETWAKLCARYQRHPHPLIVALPFALFEYSFMLSLHVSLSPFAKHSDDQPRHGW